MPLDLTDYPAIDRLGAAINERWGHLDILVGNAGLLGVITPLAHLDPKVFESVFAVNVTANWRLIRSLDPLLRQSDAGRALFVTSGITRAFLPYWGVYAASKAALEALVAHLRGGASHHHEGNGQPVQPRAAAHAACARRPSPGEDPETLKPPEAVVPDILRMLSPSYRDNGVLFDFPSGITSTFR